VAAGRGVLIVVGGVVGEARRVVVGAIVEHGKGLVPAPDLAGSERTWNCGTVAGAAFEGGFALCF
jgi:hypothetical protein